MASWKVVVSGLLLVSNGCRDDESPLGPDASAGCRDCGPLTVTASTYAGPLAPTVPAVNVSIISLRGDEVIDEAITDNSGEATLDAAPGGSIVAVFRHSAVTHVTMYTNVQPGDRLVPMAEQLAFAPGVTMTASYPELADTVEYIVWNPCAGWGTNVTSVTMMSNSSCHRDPTDFVFVAKKQVTFGRPVQGWAVKTAPAVPDGTVSIDAWNPPTTATFAVRNWTGSQHVNMFLTGVFPNGTRYTAEMKIGDVPFNGCDIENGSCDGTAEWVGAPPRIVGLAQLGLGVDAIRAVIGDPAQPSWTLDNPRLPPRAFVMSQGGSTSSWTLQGGDGPYDFIVSTFIWGTDDKRTEWRIYSPPGTTTASLPSLPAAYADVLPAASDQLPPNAAFVIELDGVDGYDGARGFAERDLRSPGLAVEEGRLSGAYVLQ